MLPVLYGLDIETDTATGGLDPRRSAVVAAAVCGPDGDVVFDGAERQLLGDLDAYLRDAPAGVVVTWNGAKFDLPFLVDRASIAGVPLGLRLTLDPAIPLGRGTLPGHAGAYRARWHRHAHLDAFRAFADIGGALAHSCSLKTVARLCGFRPVEVDAARIHDLDLASLRTYVASDARVTRQLALLRGEAALAYVDPRLSRSDVA